MAKKSFLLIFVLLILYLVWQALSPARYWINIFKRVDLSDPAATGERLVQKYSCQKCHRIAGEGAVKAADLSGVTARLSDSEIGQWLRNPRSVERRTAMPDFRLSDSEITAIIAYLRKLDTETQK